MDNRWRRAGGLCALGCKSGLNPIKKKRPFHLIIFSADITLTGPENTTTETMTTQEVANRFDELAQQGNWHQILDELFSADAKSIEPEGAPGLKSVTGLDQIRQKGKEWEQMIEETHGGYCSKSLVAGNYFTCAMGVEATFKGRGRQKLDEIALYKVENGKIVSEQFFF